MTHYSPVEGPILEDLVVVLVAAVAVPHVVLLPHPRPAPAHAAPQHVELLPLLQVNLLLGDTAHLLSPVQSCKFIMQIYGHSDNARGKSLFLKKLFHPISE